jgi:hypothetical protein
MVLAELLELFLDDAADEVFAGKNGSIVGDFFLESFVFFFDLAPF